eukprot:6434257-Amphidinium_carterae.1
MHWSKTRGSILMLLTSWMKLPRRWNWVPGLAGLARTRAQMDSTFGKGRWRPIPRHIVHQGDKYRPIDDGKRAVLNEAVPLEETIVCQSGEFIANVVKALMRALPSSAQTTFAAGLEDMWKGYRKNFASWADRRFCVITYVHPDSKKR